MIVPATFIILVLAIGLVLALTTKPSQDLNEPNTYFAAGRESWLDPTTKMWVKRISLFTGLAVLIVLAVAGTIAVVISIFN